MSSIEGRGIYPRIEMGYLGETRPFDLVFI